jgi:hypothetical protein
VRFPEFEKFQADLLKEVVGMGDTKGREYANDADRFANFRRLATQLGLPDVAIAWVYTVKHLDAIGNYVKDGKSHSAEPICGRIVDAITYLTLIAGMIHEGTEGNIGRQQPFEYDPTPRTVKGGAA